MKAADVLRLPPASKLRLRARSLRKLLLNRTEMQLLTAILLMVVGAWLVAWWMVGVTLMVGGLLFGADAVLRDDGGAAARKSTADAHEDVLERYRRAR